MPWIPHVPHEEQVQWLGQMSELDRSTSSMPLYAEKVLEAYQKNLGLGWSPSDALSRARLQWATLLSDLT